jgi:MFS family permease
VVLALTVFASSVFMGPMVTPFIGGFTVTSYLGWHRGVYWSIVMEFGTLISMALFMKETIRLPSWWTKSPVHKELAIHAKQEEVEIDLQEMVSKNLTRPMRMFFTEPILFLVTIYLSFVYGFLYTFLTGSHSWLQPQRRWPSVFRYGNSYANCRRHLHPLAATMGPQIPCKQLQEADAHLR